MRSFEFESVEQAYPELLKALLEEGQTVSPRGMLTKEISPVGITINNPRKRVLSHPIRKINHGFSIGELLWILQGKNDLSIAHYNKQWLNFTDDNEILNGAYGQRIFNWNGGFDFIEGEKEDIDANGETIISPTLDLLEMKIDQFQAAYEQLKADPDTRQATIVLFNPIQDYRQTKDKPCTNLMRFTIRDGKLNMFVVMRSNDIWLGFPYDVFNFTMLQEIMAGKLGIEVGKYTHIVDSLHIYENNFEAARQLIETPNSDLYGNVYDSRLNESTINVELGRVFNVEAVTREIGNIVKIDVVKKLIDAIENENWRILSAVIAVYNFKKAKRDEVEIEELKKYITNEFENLL